MQRVVDYDVVLMQRDMAAKGLGPVGLAGIAKVHPATVGRFFGRTVQTAKTAEKLATALGHELARYILPISATADRQLAGQSTEPVERVQGESLIEGSAK